MEKYKVIIRGIVDKIPKWQHICYINAKSKNNAVIHAIKELDRLLDLKYDELKIQILEYKGIKDGKKHYSRDWQ